MGKTNSKLGISAIAAAVLICLAGACCGIAILYIYGDSLFNAAGIPNPLNSSQPSNPAESIVPGDTSGLPEWTVIYYSDADDEILEEDMVYDVNEMELVGSNPQLNILVQMDRAEGAYRGDGDWTDTRRMYITQDGNLDQINSEVVENLGEADMGNPQTLLDFITWTIQKYPAKKYALMLSDHGGGWTGGFSDMQSGTQLSMPQIVWVIDQAQKKMGGQKFEVIGFDACLMGMIEVYGSLYNDSNYMVASEEVIPATGWSYAAWLGQLAQDPAMSGRELTQAIVSTYINQDTAFTRASSAEIAEVEAGTTLSAVESARVPQVIGVMN